MTDFPELKLNEDGEIVGYVRFDPYEYEYGGSDEDVADFLENVPSLQELEPVRDEDNPRATGEREVEMSSEQRCRKVLTMLRYEFDTVMPDQYV